MLSVSERVAAGTALLDEKRPDWFTSIDCATLDITSSSRCICGQLYGDYWTGVKDLTNSDNTSLGTPLGFCVGDSTTEIINEAWREVIAQKRLARQPVLATA